MNVGTIINLKADERVLRVVRNHWIIYTPAAVLAAALVVAPFFAMVPLFSLGRWGVAAFGFLVFVGVLDALHVAVIAYWNAFVITSSRVVDVDQRGFFDRTVSAAPYDKIQDASYSVRGVLGTIFNFGSVTVRTAVTSSSLEMPAARNPKDVYHLITETMAAAGSGGGRSGKVAALLDAAADLSDAEARAFVTSLHQGTRPARPSAHEKEKKDDERGEWIRRVYRDDGTEE